LSDHSEVDPVGHTRSDIGQYRKPFRQPSTLFGRFEVHPDPHGDSLFSHGAGLPQDAAKNGKHGTIGSPKIQLANLFAGQYHGGTKFSVGALKVSHWLCPITLSASHDDGRFSCGMEGH
jgi:hypothetical protein